MAAMPKGADIIRLREGMVTRFGQIEVPGRCRSGSKLFDHIEHQLRAGTLGFGDDAIQSVPIAKRELERTEDAAHVELFDHLMDGDHCV